MSDLGPHGTIAATASEDGERTIRFALILNKRPVSGLNTATLKGYIRLGFMERDRTVSNANPTNTPVEWDSTNLPGIYYLTLTSAEVTHGATILHIDDGDGTTFDFQYIDKEQYGGTGNTGGVHNRET